MLNKLRRRGRGPNFDHFVKTSYLSAPFFIEMKYTIQNYLKRICACKIKDHSRALSQIKNDHIGLHFYNESEI